MLWGPDFGESSDGNTWTTGVSVDLPSLALVGNKGVGVNVAMPALALAGGKGVGVHCAGTALGAPFYQSVQSADSTGSATSLVVTAPTSMDSTQKDILIAFVCKMNIGDDVTSTGWTKILHTSRLGVLNNSVTSFYKVVTGSEPADYTFSWTTAGASFASIHHVRGADTTGTPINVSGGNNASATDPVAPTITTTVDNCMLFVACVQNSAIGITYTPPAGYTERTDQNGLGAAGAHLLDGETAQRVLAAAGATGTQTMDSTALAASDYSAQHLAVAPGLITLAS